MGIKQLKDDVLAILSFHDVSEDCANEIVGAFEIELFDLAAGQVRQLSEKQSNFDQVTRFEVIGKNGRQLVEHGVSVTASLQDDDRTLKIFLTDISEIHGRV